MRPRGRRASKGGRTTIILALADALGNQVCLALLPVHRFGAVGVAAAIDCVEFGGLIGDKAFDSDAIIAELNERGAREFERIALRAPTRASKP